MMIYRRSTLDVLQSIVSNTETIQQVLLVKHQVSMNWSQMHRTAIEKVRAISEVFDLYLKQVEEQWFDREQILGLKLEKLKSMCNEDEVFSLASRVQTETGWCHLPIMNFHLRSRVTLSDLARYIEYIDGGRKGVLLRTDRYFHYLGFYLLNNREWQKFVGKMAIPFVFMNPGYLGYSLLRGYCCIRLTAANLIKTVTPYVVKEFKR